MICSFIRSSLLNEITLCSGKAFISYNIGLRGKANKSALEGSAFHAVFEILALEKLAQQNNQPYIEHDSFGKLDYNYSSIADYIDIAYDYYNKESPGVFDDESYPLIHKLVNKGLTYANGVMDPRRYSIVAAEFPFDISLEKEWSRHSFDSPSGKVEGYLTLKGTCDLLIEDDPDTLWVVDYKTSKGLMDWGTGKEKTELTLRNDPQLKLYFYALAHSFPYQNIVMNLYFVKLDRVFTIVFDRKQLPEIEEFIREAYENIISIDKPEFIDVGPNKWKCRFCNYSKELQPGSKKTICKFFQGELANKGINKTLMEHANFSIISDYGAGGSKANRE